MDKRQEKAVAIAKPFFFIIYSLLTAVGLWVLANVLTDLYKQFSYWIYVVAGVVVYALIKAVKESK
jgi:hypothetical protein